MPWWRESSLIPAKGKPPTWTPQKDISTPKEDSGDYFRDPNAARFPTYPMEPVVRSIFETNPNFRCLDINLFACGSTLGNLLRFVRKIDVDKPFRFLVEVVGDTVFFIRRESSPDELIRDVRGYGHAFPEANTTWDPDMRGSESHQRIVRYSFGGLDCLIRFEGDGYLENKVPEQKRVSPNQAKAAIDEDSLISALSGNIISTQMNSQMKTLTVTKGSQSVPQSAIFDIKTRAAWKKEGTLSEQLPRLWLRQIPYFILACHKRGVFAPADIEVKDIRPDVAAWERENEPALSKN